MSRHVPRHERWTRLGPNSYRSACGMVRHDKGAWWAEISYRQVPENPATEAPLTWEEHFVRLGPFKRPRNAMIAAEDHTTILQRRHGERVAIGKTV
jgi:hypothetical protein